jgi:hypothetical protein
MSIKHVQFALDGVPGLNAGQRLTLVSLGEWANDEGVCWPSHDTIAKRVGVGRRQVIRILEQLEAMGVVERIERKQYSNKYRVRCDIAMSHPKPKSDVTPVAHVTSVSDVTLATPDVTSRASRCDIAMSPEPLRTTEEPPERPNPVSRQAKKVPIPDEFAMTEATWDWCREQGYVGRLVEQELVKFKLSAEANDRRYANWQSAFRNWLMKCDTDGWGQVKEAPRFMDVA